METRIVPVERGNTKTITLHLEIEVDGDAGEMAQTLAGYLADSGAPLFDDYGYDAWGGYDGPFVVSCTVRTADGRVIGSHANREKPDAD